MTNILELPKEIRIHILLYIGLRETEYEELAPLLKVPIESCISRHRFWRDNCNYGKYINLTHLNVEKSRLKSLDCALMTGLDKLEWLFCGCNFLTSVPDISNLKSLKYLDCNQNDIKYINSETFVSRSLEHFDISQNRLEDIDVSMVPSLKTLRCCYNFIQSLNNNIFSNNRELYLFHCNFNELKSLPELPRKIRFIEFGGNKFERFPNLMKYKQLVMINCNKNQINRIHDLTELKELRRLCCSDNPLLMDPTFVVSKECDVWNH